MWLDHVGLAAPLEQIEGDPDTIGKSPRRARERRHLPARRAAPLARLLRRPGGRGAGRAHRPLRPRQRDPGPRRARWSRSSACPIEIGQPEALAGLDAAHRRPPHPPLRPRPGALAMRPVNLIPREERPGERKPMRGGPLAYIVVGALAAAVLGVAAAGRHRQPDLRQQGRNRHAGKRNSGRRSARAKRSAPTPSSTASANSGSRPSPASPTAASTGSG